VTRLGWPAPLALLLMAATAGCTAEATSKATTPPPFADCAALTTPPSSAPSLTGVSATPGAVTLPDLRLPDLRLPCFAGGQPLSLRNLRGPAVINIWASWCGPCRTELPVVQALADRADGQLTVLGVDTGDSRAAGASFGTDRGVTMPTLFDADRKLLDALARTTLPVTVFLDSAGRSFVYPLPLDARGLAEQVRTHTGVTVTP
jgi:cytochrome c biogenesis protein CcmG/thiol:disulfide interchange protein DsbE